MKDKLIGAGLLVSVGACLLYVNYDPQFWEYLRVYVENSGLMMIPGWGGQTIAKIELSILGNDYNIFSINSLWNLIGISFLFNSFFVLISSFEKKECTNEKN